MGADQKGARVAGVLFIAATVSAVAAAAVLPPVTGPDYLPHLAEGAGRTSLAAVLFLVAAGTSVGIAIALYPVLSRTQSALALGAVVFRTIEAVFYVAAVVSLLSVAGLAHQFVEASAPDRSMIQLMADSALSDRDRGTLAGVFALCVGSFMYAAAFHRSALIPRWLSLWGLAGSLVFAAGGLVSLVQDEPVTAYYPFFLPLAVWEMVLAIRLLTIGFENRRAVPVPVVD